MSTRDQARFLPGGRAPRADAELSEVPTIGRDTAIAGRAMVVVLDDRAGEQSETVGPLMTELLEEEGFLVSGVVSVMADEDELRKALETAVVGGMDVVVTVGGTGVAPRDVAPEATASILDQRLDGIAEALRSSGLAAGAVDAVVSRGLVGVSASTVIVNLAPSRAAIRDGMATLCPLVAYVVGQLSALDNV